MSNAEKSVMPENVPQRKIMVLATNGFVLSHWAYTNFIAQVAQDTGYEVMVVTCKGAFESCISKRSMVLEANSSYKQRLEICKRCRGNQEASLCETGFDHIDFSELMSIELYSMVSRLVDSCEDPQTLKLDGINFGSLALHDVHLERKLMHGQELDEDTVALLKQILRTSILTYLLTKQTIAQFGVTDVVVFNEYAQHIGALYAAKSLGANWRIMKQVLHLGGNADNRRIMLTQQPWRQNMRLWNKRWPSLQDIPMTEPTVIEVTQDIICRFAADGGAMSTGLSRKSIATELFGRDDRKLVVLFTSSLDEIHAQDMLDEHDIWVGENLSVSKVSPFDSQIDWIKNVIQQVSERDDTDLVVRIHPREGKVKGGGVESTHLKMLKAELTDLPEQVRVLWPDTSVSAYDLIDGASLVSTFGSTTGLEAARLGIPVICANPNVPNHPMGDFIEASESVDAFNDFIHSTLSAASGDDWDLDKVLRAWRYYAFTRLHVLTNFSDVIPNPRFIGLIPFRPPRMGKVFMDAFDGDGDVVDVNIREGLGRNQSQNRFNEKRMLKQELIRIIHFMMTGISLQRSLELRFSEPVESDQMARVDVMGNQIRYETVDGVYERSSMVTQRLLKMVQAL